MTSVVPGARLPEMPAALDTWGTRRGATWTLGMVADVAEVVAYVKAAKELEGR